jgi:hypothetical protein
MKVTEKKFLNVHQTMSPLTVGVVTSGSSKQDSNPATAFKTDKLLVSLEAAAAAKMQSFSDPAISSDSDSD